MKQSAGILVFRRRMEDQGTGSVASSTGSAASSIGSIASRETIEVLLVHPGGPFWKNKDVWSIPKGEYKNDENPFDAATREFFEETGLVLVFSGTFAIFLGDVKYPSNKKIVTVWAVEGDCDTSTIHSNMFSMEWPPKSGKQQEFPEIDRGEWFPIDVAKCKIQLAQIEFLERLIFKLQN